MIDMTPQMYDELRSAEDIRNLLVRYGLYLDQKNFEGYVSLFTTDGVLDAPLGSATGPENIRGACWATCSARSTPASTSTPTR